MFTSKDKITNDIKTNLNKNTFELKYDNDQQSSSDNEEVCSCSTCECSSCIDEDNYNENILENKTTSLTNSSISINRSTLGLVHKTCCSIHKISHMNDSHSFLNNYNCSSVESNRPSIAKFTESIIRSIPWKVQDTINIPPEVVSTKQANVQIMEQPVSIHRQKSENFKSIENRLTDKPTSEIDFQHMYETINQSYLKIPILYNSIKQTRLDTDFILSVNDYLERLKVNIYKDLIRRETLLRNGKNHAKNLISLVRCICKISYKQAVEITNDSMISKRAIIYTMTAIDHILQCNFPQKKPLFNFILNEYISMWLHESLRMIQEDFCIIVENGTRNNFFLLCICLFHKLESICAINWERLQMIQNYRLAHFNELMKPTSVKLERTKDFVQVFGKPVISKTKKSKILITSLYLNRTDNEINNIHEIEQIFKNSIAKILFHQCDTLKNILGLEDDAVASCQSHSQQIIIPANLSSKSKEPPTLFISDDSQLTVEKSEPDKTKSTLSKLDQQASPTSNIISEVYTQCDEPVVVLPRHVSSISSSTKPFLISLKSDKSEEQNQALPSESKLVSMEHKKQILSNERTTNENKSSKLTLIHVDQLFSPSNSSLLHLQSSIKTMSNASSRIETTDQTSTVKRINRNFESMSNVSTPLIFIKSELKNNASQHIRDKNNFIQESKVLSNFQNDDYSIQQSMSLACSSPQKTFTKAHISCSLHQTLSDNSIEINSESILNAEVNELIIFLQQIAYSSLLIQQERKTPSLLKLLQCCLKQSSIDSNLILEQIQNTHPQSSLNVKDPIFLAAFTRVLRQELNDAQILRKINCEQLNEDSQNIGHSSFETANILKLPKTELSLKNKSTDVGDNIDQSHVFIEVTHDPKRCKPISELSDFQYQSCRQLPQKYQQLNNDSSPKSTNTPLIDYYNNQKIITSLDLNHSPQQWNWLYSNKSSVCNNCIITHNSICCERNSLDKSTDSITVEHNENF
ncbi:unnamed protein product [Rotaria socialis]|uniref:Uncharacterized protein n=1 Tax=Rotaria socialis TaxID=392032 RepID=A0A817PNE1_9BILA|nr:unnamed protein product [Rotaria socialis]CAF3166436.1 unnamed protein product [Rotaria socialis]CAF4176859.1 unnamed protein product [Rotaria socialis]CAF4286527.1 unnamed protein product [Rotaria socialis]